MKINTSNCSYLMDSEHQTVSRKSFSFSHSPDCCSDWDYVLLLTYAFPFLSLEHYAHSTSSLIWGINDSVYQKSDLTKKIISKILFFFFSKIVLSIRKLHTIFQSVLLSTWSWEHGYTSHMPLFTHIVHYLRVAVPTVRQAQL